MVISDFYSKITDDYKKELTAFYLPHFEDTNALHDFVSIAFNYDKKYDKIRFMIQQIHRFVSLANDIDSVRPGRDSLRMLFIKVCMESLCKISEKNKQDFFTFFSDCFSKKGKEYILQNFKFTGISVPESLDTDKKLMFDTHGSYSLTISDFLEIIKAVRDNVVHDGDYWTMQFFARDKESICFVDFSCDDKVLPFQKKGEYNIFNFTTTMQYDMFMFYFVEACVNFIKEYINQQTTIESVI